MSHQEATASFYHPTILALLGRQRVSSKRRHYQPKKWRALHEQKGNTPVSFIPSNRNMSARGRKTFQQWKTNAFLLKFFRSFSFHTQNWIHHCVNELFEHASVTDRTINAYIRFLLLVLQQGAGTPVKVFRYVEPGLEGGA